MILGGGMMMQPGGVGFAQFRSVDGTSAFGVDDIGRRTCPKPTGVALGDLVIALGWSLDAGATLKNSITAEAFNRHELGGIGSGVNQAVLFWKLMTAASDVDTSSPSTVNWWTNSSGGVFLPLAYVPHGATGVAVRSEVAHASGQPSILLGGFQPSGYGALVLYGDRDPDAAPVVAPNYFAARAVTNSFAGFYTAGAWDMIDYNGGNVGLSGLAGVSNLAEAAWLLEFI